MNANQSPTGSESFRGLQVPQSFAPLSQELNGADFRAVSAMPSGTSSASLMDSEMLQRTGAPQAGLKAVPEGSKLVMLTGDEFVQELSGDKSLDPSPVGRMHSQSPPPMMLQAQSSPTSALETQVALMSSQLIVLANAVQGIVNHASSGRADKPRSSGKPPSSPGPSSSSSSNSSGKSSKDKKPGKGGSDGGGSSPGGSPSGSGASSPSNSPVAKDGIDAYALEKKLMRVKTYESLKLPTLPKNASEARTFKNGMFNVICKLAKADEAPAFKWISRCAKPDADLSDSSPYPVLDRVLGSKLLEMSKNTRFAMQFQTMQEEAQKHGRQPKGRKLLWVVFEKFKMEKDKGVSLTQSHLLGLKVQGNDIQALENFRNKFDYVWQALEVEERPSSSAIRSLLFEQLKNHPSMMLTIDKFRNASTGSSKRTYQWLYDKLIEAIEIHQLEENSSNLEKSLSQFAKVAASPSKPEKAEKPDKSKKEKPEKPNKEKKEESTVKDKNKN